ncbi:ArfGap-domain-containing protein [Aspergillus steynii IBT 23096]|uniref:ArfGap-domain-containing protein n=1 Tax=Aspergillus steynii IBT 23096 TaxID=1392250 RepID=A0A2I2GRG6_9EURO|nr:ArfGap-domain-containing protein [Aspergillus steynii IBT 23096]PLB55469.1 ArfGap-domain-containing protein [Aspergillus steynii IBT 23096]
MSRRATPSQAAQNQQTIKNLLKLEYNKTCADCKRNKHPRWASWNLGIFICIRCSGIHRGMGTHISRVKSVDLDAWTDEQLQSVLRWGNGRANKYWEAKLAPGHVPSEAKIENFIRTKYDSKRWVMDGPMPDPSTLDTGDDDVPLAVVQEKAKLERSASQRVATSSQPPAPQRQQPAIDLFGDDISPPVRPSTTEPTPRAAPKPQQPPPQAAPKPQRPGDSLLGLDFFGSTQPAPSSRPASTASTPTNPTGMSRPDLKQSILSLYSKPQPAPAQHERTSSFGDLASPAPQSGSSMGGLTDAFSGLSFPSTTSPPPPKPAEKPSPFANLTSFAKSTPAAPKVSSPTASAAGGGSLFDSLTSPTIPPAKPQSRTTSISSNGFDSGFGGFASPPPTKPKPPPSSSLSNDLLGLSSPPPAPAAKSPSPPAAVASPQQELSSAFNISAPPPPKPQAPAASTASIASALPAMDPWGGNAWSTPDPAPPAPSTSTTAASMMKVPDTLTANDIGAGWGAPSPSASSSKPAPTVAADEDFGGWASAAPVSSSTTATSSTKPAGGFGGADDLFSNVWE